MSIAVATARRMLEQTGEHPVVSVYLDLDPSRFATAPARATQVRSLIDEADRDGRMDKDELSHADRTTLTADLQRLEAYLGSDEPPVSGARALAVFCSGQDDLFEALPLPVAMPARVVIASSPYIEPLVAGPAEGRVAVALARHGAARRAVAFHLMDYYLGLPDQDWNHKLKADGVKVWGLGPGMLETDLGNARHLAAKMGAKPASVGGEFIRTVVEGERDADVGKIVNKDGISEF